MKTESLNTTASRSSEEISVKDLILKLQILFYYIRSKWLFIVGVVIVFALIGFIYASQKKAIYTATTTFVLEGADRSGGGMGQYAGLASMVGIDIGGSSSGGGIFQGDNLLELYKSRTMIEKTLLSPFENGNSKLLIDRYIDFNNLRTQWHGKPQLANISFDSKLKSQSTAETRLKDSIINIIVGDINQNYLAVNKLDKKLSIIRVDVKSADEPFAKSFNDRIVYNVNQFYVLTKTKKAIDNVTILQHKTDSVRSVLNGAIYASASVADATPNLNPTRQAQRTAPMQRSQFTAESNKAVLSLLIQNLEMSKMSLLQATPLIQVVDNPVFPLERSKLSRLKAMIIGGFLGGFLAVIVIIIKRIIKSVLS